MILFNLETFLRLLNFGWSDLCLHAKATTGGKGMVNNQMKPSLCFANLTFLMLATIAQMICLCLPSSEFKPLAEHLFL